MRKCLSSLFFVSLSVFALFPFIGTAVADSVTQANLSTPPSGWTRVAPNFVLASPQRVVFTWPTNPNNVLKQVNFSEALGAAAGIPHVVLVKIVDIVGTSGVNTYSSVHTASYWDAGNTELDAISSIFLSSAALGEGVAGRMGGQKLMIPVDASSRGYIKANDGYSGATYSEQSAILIGYWD